VVATIELTRENFEQIVAGNEVIFIDFWAPWCAPCRVFGPVFESASQKHSDAVFGKVNTEQQKELAGMFGIRSIPTLMVFREQIGVFRQAGALPASALEDVIDQVKKLDMDDVRQKLSEGESATE
jgi:thioredoxin